MNEELPVYPLELGQRLKGDWFPLHFDRLLGSRFVAVVDRDAAFVAVLLWSEAMRQDPAGTLPDDDQELAQLAGCGRDLADWRDLRARGALYRWEPYLCQGESEDRVRLGHPVVAEVARDSVARMNAKAEESARGAERALASRLRRKMREAGAHAGFTEREDVVDAVLGELRARGVRWTQQNVREAMDAAQVRLDQAEGGLLGGVAGIPRRFGDG